MCTFQFFIRACRQRASGGRSAGRPAGRPGGARVVSGAEKKSFDRGGPVWPPRSNVTNDRLRGGVGAGVLRLVCLRSLLTLCCCSGGTVVRYCDCFAQLTDQ